MTVDVPTLLGLQDNPAELAGYGPIPAELAHILAADGPLASDSPGTMTSTDHRGEPATVERVETKVDVCPF